MKIAFALGSGAARALAHLGALKFLEEKEIKPDIITGTSMGAFLSALYATGLSIDEMINIACELNWRKLGGSLDVSLHHGLIEGQKFEDFLSRMIPVDTFEECSCNLGLVSTNLTTGDKVYHSSGPLIPAIHASMSFPGILSPVVSGKDILMDGGLTEPIPYGIARKMGADRIIAMNVNPSSGSTFKTIQEAKPFFHHPVQKHISAPLIENWLMMFKQNKAPEQTDNVFQIFYKSIVILQNNLADDAYKRYKTLSIQICPLLKGIRLFDFYRAKEIIQQGYQCAQANWKNIQKLLSTYKTEDLSNDPK